MLHLREFEEDWGFINILLGWKNSVDKKSLGDIYLYYNNASLFKVSIVISKAIITGSFVLVSLVLNFSEVHIMRPH